MQTQGAVPELDPNAVAKLASRKEAERAAAEASIERLGPAAVDALLNLLRAEASRRAKRRRVGIAIFCLYVLLFATMVISGNGKVMGSFGGLISVGVGMLVASQAQKSATNALTRYDDLRAVGPLVEALDYGDKRLAQAAESTLVRLLPRLTADRSYLLEESHRKVLNRLLTGQRSQLLAEAILTAYEQVGDSRCVEALEKLAGGGGKWGRVPSVRQAAASALAASRVRARRDQASGTLLRAAGPEAEGERLLRAADSGSAPETLLRPIDPPTNT